MSEIDESANFVKQHGKSIYECRYVRREESQVVVYLSSHNGCNMSCRFCHLTSTGQTSMTPVDQYGFDEQALIVLDYWYNNKRTGGEKIVNYNFMARGEPLENPKIRNYGHWMTIRRYLWEQATVYKLEPRYNISTILPKNGPELRSYVQPDTKLYWSLYSPLEKFRKRWLPKAMEPNQAADEINNFRDRGGKVVLHNAFIKGENDTPEQIEKLIRFIECHALQQLDYNIVRYNPYDERYGEESDRLDEIQQQLQDVMKGRVQVVPRVGRDVYASCGTFINGRT